MLIDYQYITLNFSIKMGRVESLSLRKTFLKMLYMLNIRHFLIKSLRQYCGSIIFTKIIRL